MQRNDLAPILRAVRDNDGQCGRSMIAKILRGSRDKRLLELGLDRSDEYGALSTMTLERIGFLIDEALSLGLINMRDAGWDRGRRREDAHFPVLSTTVRGERALRGIGAPGAVSVEDAGQQSPEERARLLSMRAMVQGAYGLEDHKHRRIEAADFIRESPGDHLVLFAMERHPRGETLMCLYLWNQRNNVVAELDTTPAGRVSDVDRWFRRRLVELRRSLEQP